MIPSQPESVHIEPLTLEPFESAWITSEYVNWLNDKELMRFSRQKHMEHTTQSCQHYLDDIRRNQHFFWGIFLAKKHIGNVTAYIDRQHQTANLALLIGHPDAKGKGFGKQAWQMAMNYLFDSGIYKVHAGTVQPNDPMVNIFKSSGMTIEGRLKNHMRIDDQYVDVLLAGAHRKST